MSGRDRETGALIKGAVSFDAHHAGAAPGRRMSQDPRKGAFASRASVQ